MGNEKYLEALVGFSRNMDKTVSRIEEILVSGQGKRGGNGGNSLINMMNTLVGGIGSFFGKQKIRKKDADVIVNFSSNMVKISNQIKPGKGLEFAKTMKFMGEGLDSIEAMVSPVKMIKLYIGSKILFGGKKPLLQTIVEGMTKALKDASSETIVEGAKSIKYLGDGLFMLSKAMGAMALIGLAAPLVAIGSLVTWGVVKLFSSLGNKTKEIEEGGNSMVAMGKGLIALSAGLATMTLVMLIVKPKMILESMAVIAAYSLLFILLGKGGDALEKGARGVALMSLALIGFSAGLATLMLAIILSTPKMILEGLLVFTSFALIFAVIGKGSEMIARGALVTIGIGLAIAAFSLGLMVMELAIKNMTMEAALLAPLLIAEFGTVFYVLGGFSKEITKGSYVLEGMGVGLGLFSVGLILFALSMKLMDSKAMLMGPLLIMGFGLSIAVLGAGPIPEAIGLGSTSLASMGVGLGLFSVGLILFGLSVKGIMALFKDGKEAALVAGGLIAGLGLAIAGLGLLSPLIILGSVAMTTMGVALATFSVGLLMFSLTMKAVTAMFKGKNELAEKSFSLITKFGLSFSVIGVLTPLVILGSVALTTMSVALATLSVGLLAFGGVMKFYQSKNLFVKDSKGKYSVVGMNIISGIGKEISKLGIMMLNPFYILGVAAALGFGVALTSISIGLKAAGEALSSVKDVSAISKSIFGEGGLVLTLAEQFSKIGKRYGGGFLNRFLGTDDVSIGVKTVRGFGDVLSKLAGGIVAFSNFSEFPVKVPNPKDPSKLMYSTVDVFGDIIPKLTENLPSLLTVLSTIFGDIGKKYGGEGLLNANNYVKKGVRTVKGFGNILTKLAGGIVAFSRFENFPVEIPDPKDPSKLIYKSINLYDSIPLIKKALIGDGSISGSASGNSGLLFSLANVFAEIGQKYPGGFLQKSDVKKGANAVKDIGRILSDLAGGIVSFANMQRGLPNFDKNGKFDGTYTKIDLVSVGAGIERIVKILPGAFAGLNLEQVKSAQDKADKIYSLVKTMTDIGKKFEKLNDTGKYMNSFMMDYSKFIEKNNSVKMEGMNRLYMTYDILGKMSSLASPLERLSSSMSSLGVSFEKFGSGFSKFSLKLKDFMSFEKIFSSLSKNAYVYKFDKFANSMGTLKRNVNSFDVENLKLTDSLMKSLAILSKDNELAGKEIQESIDDAMKLFVEEMKKVLKEISESNSKDNSLMNDNTQNSYGFSFANEKQPSKETKKETPVASAGDESKKKMQDFLTSTAFASALQSAIVEGLKEYHSPRIEDLPLPE